MNFCQSGLHLREVSRSRSKAVSASKMDHFVIIANGWKPLTIITKRSVLDVASALDSPLELREVYTPLLLYGWRIRFEQKCLGLLLANDH